MVPIACVAGGRMKKLASEIAAADPAVRVFRMSEMFIDDLREWSRPVQLKLSQNADGTYDLQARTVEELWPRNQSGVDE